MTTSPEPGQAVLRPTIKHLADPVNCLALGFGSGLAPFAPGTFGSLVGLAVALALAPLGFAWNLGATLLAIVAGIWICGESARRLGVHDHPAIVWDEIAGMMITMLAVPDAWWGVPLAFVLFGGDDYELLFTVSADRAAGFDAGTFAGVPVHRIGVVEAGAGVRCERDGCVVDLRGGGYDHFA